MVRGVERKFEEPPGSDRRSASALKLKFIQSAVNTAALKKFRMRAGFDNFAFAEHNNEVGPLDRRQPVGDADGGAALHELFQLHLDDALTFRVQRVGGLV